jgi:hypothetical protein
MIHFRSDDSQTAERASMRKVKFLGSLLAESGAATNRRIWDADDWGRRGEEWTP